MPIKFPAINGVDGSTCGEYQYGWTSGCTYPDDTNRGFTQDWYFEGRLGAWVSSTERKNVYGSVERLGSLGQVSLGETYDAALTRSKSFVLSFADSMGSLSSTIRFTNPPASDEFGEITLIVDNPNHPTDLYFVGVNSSGVTGDVYMDTNLAGTEGADGLSAGIHMWKVWTIDGGQKYYVYRANGFGRYWDDD